MPYGTGSGYAIPFYVYLRDGKRINLDETLYDRGIP
jgi:hypothetical protein